MIGESWMKNLIKTTIALLLISLPCLFTLSYLNAEEEHNGRSVESIFREQIGKPEGKLWKSDFSEVTRFEVHDEYIHGLEFFEKFPNLKELILESVYPDDLSGIAKCTGLEKLSLMFNDLTDITPLAGLTNLVELNISRSFHLSDAQVIKNFTKLKSLEIGWSNIRDISFLEDTPEIEMLDMYGLWIKDYSPLMKLPHLKDLSLTILDKNNIRIIDKLTGLTHLEIEYVRIKDISFLENFENLQKMSIHGFNQPWPFGNSPDIKFLKNMKSLKDLSLKSMTINDLAPVGELTELESLELHDVNLRSYKTLSRLTNLKELTLFQNSASDFEHLSTLTQLTKLHIYFSDITDFSFLNRLDNLESLTLSADKMVVICPVILHIMKLKM
jgi:internalin A